MISRPGSGPSGTRTILHKLLHSSSARVAASTPSPSSVAGASAAHIARMLSGRVLPLILLDTRSSLRLTWRFEKYSDTNYAQIMRGGTYGACNS